MFTQEELYHQIEAFLNNELSAEECEKFKERLKSDLMLSKEVELHRKIIQAIRSESMDSTREMLDATDRRMAVETNKSRRYLYMAVAAIVILIIGAGITFYILHKESDKSNLVQQIKKESLKEENLKLKDDSLHKHRMIKVIPAGPGSKLIAGALYDKYFEAFPSRFGSSRGLPEDSFQMAMNYYNQKKYDDALSLFNRLLTKPQFKPKFTDIKFYTAICFMTKGKYKKAYKIIEKLSSVENPYQNESKWYLALLQVKKNRPNMAIATLNSIIESGTYNSGKAVALLNEIKNQK